MQTIAYISILLCWMIQATPRTPHPEPAAIPWVLCVRHASSL